MIRGLGITSILVCLAAAAGCAEVNGALGGLNKTLEAINGTLGPPGSVQPISTRRGPEMSPEQLEGLHAALAVKMDDRHIALAIEESRPIIRDLAKTEACIASSSRESELRVYGAPGTSLGNWHPMYSMRYHDKSKCLSVVRIHGWRMPARNALQFEILYLADDSAETRAQEHELVKQPGGEWLFSR